MVDFSVFFLVIRFIVMLTQEYVFPNINTVAVICGMMWVVTFVPGFILGKIPKNSKTLIHAIFAKTAEVFMGLSLLTLFLIVWPMIVEWEIRTFGISGKRFEMFVGGSLLMIIICSMFVISRLYPNEPNNKSLLNVRQAFTVTSIIALIVFVFFAMYYLHFATFRVTIIVMFWGAECLSILLWFYDPCIYIISQVFRSKKKVPCEPMPNCLNRFAVIGCARNGWCSPL